MEEPPRSVALALFDAGGVLLLPEVKDAIATLQADGLEVDAIALDRAHYAGMAAVDAVAAGMPLPAGGLTAAVWAEGLRDRYRSAKLRSLAVTEPCPAHLEASLFASPWTRAAPRSVDVLRAIAELAIPMAVVSNAGGTVEAELKAAGICQVGAGNGVCVAAVIDSSLVGVAKPDPRIFRFALEAAGVPSERAVFVGDSVAIDVRGARLANIRAFHFDPYGFCDGRDHPDLDELRELLPLLTR